MNCPDQRTWELWRSEKLPQDLSKSMREHLASCASCQEHAKPPTPPTELETRTCEPPTRVEGSRTPGEATVAQLPEPGDRLAGRYLVLSKVGEGGMGVVLAAHDLELNRRVAIKLFQSSDGSSSPHREPRLLREAQALAQLSHPNVVTIFDVGVANGRVFLAMELVEGETLRAWLRAQTRSWREVVRLFVAAGRGLAAAHRAGLVHRDFKPSNVLLSRDGTVRVADFGLARAQQEMGPNQTVKLASGRTPSGPYVLYSDLTLQGMVVGTMGYIAPELIRGSPATDRSDQFAYCVSLYEGLYGKRPFDAEGPDEFAAQVRAGLAASAKRGGAPRRIQRLLRRGLSLEPSDRYPSMDDLLAELSYDAGRGRRAALTIGAAAAVALVAGGGFVVVARERLASCATLEQRLEGVWDDKRRAAGKAAFGASRLGFALASWEGIALYLDDYSRRWANQSRQSCEAHVRGTLPDAAYTAQLGCLDRRLSELRALSELLGAATDKVVVKGAEAARALSSLERCAELEALTSAVPPPDDAAVAEAVASHRRTLSRARALGMAAQVDTAVGLTEQVLDGARKLDYRPLEAEALVQLGELHVSAGDGRKAQKLLFEAIAAAEACGHQEVRAQAWVRLIRPTAVFLEQVELGGACARIASGMARHASIAPELEAQLLADSGAIAYLRKDFEEAEGYFQRCIDFAQRRLAPDSVPFTLCLNGLGALRNDTSRYDEAQLHFERAIEAIVRRGGKEHPDLSKPLSNLALCYQRKGDLALVMETYERALRISESAFGPENAGLVVPLINLANSAWQAERYDDAMSYNTRAAAVIAKLGGPETNTYAAVMGNMGEVRLSQGRAREALKLFERGLAIRTKVLDPKNPDLAEMLNGVAACKLALRDTRGALPLLERALTLAEGTPGSVEYVGIIRFNLGRALWETQKDRPRALELLRKGYAGLLADKQAMTSRLPSARAWLASAKLASEVEPAP